MFKDFTVHYLTLHLLIITQEMMVEQFTGKVIMVMYLILLVIIIRE